MRERIARYDWAATPLGPMDRWPQALRLATGLCLNSAFPMAIYWGADLRLIYNDGWSPIPGIRHPDALGRPGREVWPDIWHIVGPQFREVMASGIGYSAIDQHLPMTRSGRLEESYWDYSFTPIVDETGQVSGILNQGHEVTARVQERQRQVLLMGMADRLRAIEDGDAIIAEAIDRLGPYLGVARVGYAEIDMATGLFRVLRNWRRDDGVADLRGEHRLGAFGDEMHRALRTGAVFSIDDTEAAGENAEPEVAERYRAAGIRAGLVVPVLKDGTYAAAIFVQDDAPRQWTVHHETLLGAVAERIWQERTRAQASRALRESEERHRLLFAQANDIIFTAGMDQTIIAANPAAGRALGVPPETLVGRSVADFVPDDSFPIIRDMLRRKLAGGGTTHYEVPVRCEDGRMLRWEVNSSLAIDHDGRPIGLHAIARDVTERHADEQHQRRLINELNHRVKNMLALVQALALQSFKGDKPLPDAQGSFQARLAALAGAHDLLTREKWEGATLGEIAAVAVAPMARAAGQVSLEGPSVVLPPKTAVSLVMAVHELATNAARYGALSTEEGRLSVRWRRIGEDRLSIAWAESGGPEAMPPARRGFGLRMVERALASDLSARVAMDFAPTGLVCTIEAPLPAGLAT